MTGYSVSHQIFPIAYRLGNTVTRVKKGVNHMRVFPIVLVAGLMLGTTGCAAVPPEESTNSANVPNNAPASVAPDEREDPTRDIDPLQPKRLLGEVEESIVRAAAEGFVETITFPGDPIPSIVAYDPSRPAGEMGALIVDGEFALSTPAENPEDLMSGFLEIRGEATAMVNLIETGAEGAGNYENIIADDGFIFNSTGNGNRVHVITDENGIIQSFSSNTPDGDLVYAFQYGLTQEDKDLIESAYAFDDSEIVYD